MSAERAVLRAGVSERTAHAAVHDSPFGLFTMTGCWLQQFSDKPCEGRLIRAHLVPRQLLRREFGFAYKTIADDPRCWVWSCGGALGPGGHHGMLDHSRTLRIPREALPEGVELFCADYDLLWFLDREYGPLEDIAA